MIRARNLLLAIFVVACTAGLTWPGYAWLGNRIEPYVLGLPFSFAWILGWIAASFVALLLYHWTAPPESPGLPEPPEARRMDR